MSLILKRFRTFVSELSAATIVNDDRIYVGDTSEDDDAYITFANLAAAIRPANATPASASATGVAGTISWDGDFIYVCTATDTWKRVAIATWP